jgi:hypothetical protein
MRRIVFQGRFGARRRYGFGAAAALALWLMVSPAPAQAQARLRPPIPTTLVIVKPIRDPAPLDSDAIWLGVSGVSYGFRLLDAYTDVPDGDAVWMSVWQLAREFRPNFQVMGQNMEKVALIKTGQTVTVRGMYAPLTRTFEITEILEGRQFAPPSHY